MAHNCVVFNNAVWLLAGRRNGSSLNDVWIYAQQ
ncbi:hypothetical protein ACFL27_17900 [candidate division CSSED10-310 bacterium]|uniref:Uncharacterized protein n=1 Tax=candidate division CSSED10-310 bacterium TaxID=2855610 RepID=A0ABV6Z0U6_UNCC1